MEKEFFVDETEMLGDTVYSSRRPSVFICSGTILLNLACALIAHLKG